MAKRSRLAEDVIGLAKTLKVDDKLEGLCDEDLREVDLETALALGMERPKAAKIACRIRSVSASKLASTATPNGRKQRRM